MNEDTVRTLLADVAATPEPPSRISVEAARTAGRRRQWANRAIASAGVAAVAAVVVAGVVLVPHFRSAGTTTGAAGAAAGTEPAAQTTGVKPSAPAPAPAQFNPQVLAANFGWLPSFWNENGASITVTPTLTVVNLVHGQTLKVSARGWYPSDAEDGNFATVRGSFPGAATDPKAPPVNGRPAYWDNVNDLVWEYAPGAWAYLYGAGNVQASVGRALDEEMASKVQFGLHQPVYFPFHFAHGLPAGWQVTEIDSLVTNGRPLVWQVEAGPAADSQALTIADDPQSQACNFQPPPQSWVTVGGIRFGYYYSTGPGGDQSACATTRVAGRGYVTMYYYWRGHAQALNLGDLMRSMTFSGSNPADWTASPLLG